MKVSVIGGRELSPDLRSRWNRMLDATPEIESAFLRPEYAVAVASACDDVYVGVVEDGGEAVGFLPFQRGPFRTGRPVGAPLCEYQGFIGEAESLVPQELVSGCGLIAWEFDRLLASQESFAPYHLEVEESPIIELPAGWQSYRDALESRGSSLFKQGLRKERKLEREIGPVRFETHVADPAVLQRLLEWKSAQSRRTGIFDVFKFDWPHRMVARLHQTQGADFSGLLSAVYAGDELVAAHLGLRSRSVWHWWLPTYDVKRARYSPGVILLLHMVMAADELGVRRIDFGHGAEPYKLRASTGSIRVARGRVECPSLVTTLRKLRRGAMGTLRRSPLAHPAEAVAKLVRRGERWLRSK